MRRHAVIAVLLPLLMQQRPAPAQDAGGDQMVAVAKNYIPLLVRAMINTLTLTMDWGSYKDFKLSERSDREIAKATLVDGDKRYSNDALIEFE